ncbi:MAG: hypothetical protein JNM07_09390 [Phycisphaerae bacterium]|nr:hypothetical protein [Phycisphaerae bacterium]
MQRTLRIVISLLIVVAVVGFMTTYTVRFTETAVVTTFGKADATSVKTEPGWQFKLPYPIQSVTRYDRRARFLETRPETQQTADSRQLVVTAFLTWQVRDPLVFYQRFSNAGATPSSHYAEAEKIIRSKLRGALSAVAKFPMGELVSSDATKSKLAQLETNVLSQIAAPGEGGSRLEDYGVAALAVGISSIKLPEDTTKEVFTRMGATRDTIAARATSIGASEADAIRSRAKDEARKIMAFAERRAQEIRAQGEIEAAQYLQQMSADQDLAVFLKNIEFMREAFGKTTTLVLPTSMPGMGLFKGDASGSVTSGLNALMGSKETAPAPAKEKGK